MKIIIFGSNGMLGNYMKTYFKNKYDILEINRNIYDAYNSKIEDLERLLKLYSNDDVYVINCIGVIPQRHDLQETRKYIKVNTLFPNTLAQYCDKFNLKLIHITTDCVFNGLKGNYNENDVHDETNIYGISKSLGEPSNACVIRTSIIGEELQNKKSLLEWVKSCKNKKINGFINHYWNGVTCLQLSEIIDFMISNNIYWKGVRHVFSPSIVSKFELVKIINDIYNLNITVNEYYDNKNINKSLSTIHESLFSIPDIKTQIFNQMNFIKIL